MNRVLFCITWLLAIFCALVATAYWLCDDWSEVLKYGAFAILARWIQEEADDAHYNAQNPEDAE